MVCSSEFDCAHWADWPSTVVLP